MTVAAVAVTTSKCSNNTVDPPSLPHRKEGGRKQVVVPEVNTVK